MTVHVPGASLSVRKPNWKQLFLPEIPATRLACLTSGSFRPKLGLGILAVLILGCILLVLIPLSITPKLSSLVTTSKASASTMEFNKEAVKAVQVANHKFDQSLYQLLAEKDENLIMSSYSVNSVLAMILNGAGGNTAAQLRQGLALVQDKDLQAFNLGFKDVLNLLKSNENFTLSSANRVYYAADNSLDSNYLASTKSNFLAEPVATNFGNSVEAANSINNWVEEQTNSKIKDLVSKNALNAMTKMVLVNAIYFKGDWFTKFDPRNTNKMDFHVSPEITVQADMMFSSQKFKLAMLRQHKALAIDLPYKGERLSMVVILPDKDQTLQGLEESLSKVEDFNEALKFGEKTKVELYLPKFKIECQLELNEPLKKLGMADMFDEANADFSGMTGGPKNLYVSTIVQKAFVEVNEEGAEAAAATAGIMMMRAMVINPEFRANKPFMFLIRDNLTGMTLFSGHIVDPTKLA